MFCFFFYIMQVFLLSSVLSLLTVSICVCQKLSCSERVCVLKCRGCRADTVQLMQIHILLLGLSWLINPNRVCSSDACWPDMGLTHNNSVTYKTCLYSADLICHMRFRMNVISAWIVLIFSLKTCTDRVGRSRRVKHLVDFDIDFWIAEVMRSKFKRQKHPLKIFFFLTSHQPKSAQKTKSQVYI